MGLNTYHDGCEPYFWTLHTHERLTEQYGKVRADLIIRGRDPATQSDIAAWRKLGEGRKAAWA